MYLLRKLILEEGTIDKDTFYYNSIRDIIGMGGDTDTNAAIVGGFLGAALGLTRIPLSMVEKHLRCRTDLVKRTDLGQ
jgi:ADP-ribosylglycohydrolase